MVLLEALDNQRKSLVLILVKKTQTFAHVCIIMVMIVIHLLIKKQSLSLKLTKHMVIFQLYFVLESYLMDLVLLSLEKYFWDEMRMIFSQL